MASDLDTTEPQLPLARYFFQYRTEGELRLPPYPGGLWHGVFGARLRALSCVMPAGTVCRGCALLHHCAYSLLFSGPRPPDALLMRRYDTIPVPHVFQIDPATRAVIPAGESLRVALVLVGTANDRLPLVIQTLADAGLEGLGATRTRAILLEVIQELPDGSTQRVASQGRLSTPLPPVPPMTPPLPAAVHIRILSPYKSGVARGPADAFDPGAMLMAILRRCSLLQYFYTGRLLEAPFVELKAASARVRVIDSSLRPEVASRYAARHGQRVPTGGLIGELVLDPDGLEALWPYLHLGQWLNVGKNASMGFGRYRLTAPHAPAHPPS
ncbi:hypothetical protein CKO25_11370 [Thiocapsa imhoffii]|uniref:CRISPR-associated protein Cas6 C-terminal domain-containing protein n=1 Tax=Thiocapsa imhoffii TaxID=382777 RepID=A0A9X1B9M4_9GAMM|nr:CRISPR system precrRNA processing endoribonuclease RAMP protein Cas6 [Thiocapsa imhoffii]MBK1645230.1 hypothetical protein [Thiocapsa imhoffii]